MYDFAFKSSKSVVNSAFTTKLIGVPFQLLQKRMNRVHNIQVSWLCWNVP